MPHEAHQHAHHDHGHAGGDAVTQQAADPRLRRDDGAGRLHRRLVGSVSHAMPFQSICPDAASSTATNSSRSAFAFTRDKNREPPNAPSITPDATGAAMNGSMSPRAKYTPADAAAVTPIMKLLVAVETFSGNRIPRSKAGTLSEPAPIPSSPLTAPATVIRNNPSSGRVTRYGTCCFKSAS